MASDLLIEILAYDIFNYILRKFGVIERFSRKDFRNKYADECHQLEDYMEVRKNLKRLINFRTLSFLGIYKKDLGPEKIESFKSLTDIYEYVTHSCDREDLFGNLTVFERMHATLGFVIVVCLCIETHTNTIDVVNNGYIIWAMYFDKFTNEFHEKGGWRQLKREVEAYEFFSDWDKCIPEISLLNLPRLKQATVNYSRFKNSINKQNIKQKQTVHTSNLWIRFQVQHFESYINIPSSYGSCLEVYESELLMKDLKQIFYPQRCNSNNLEVSKEKLKETMHATEMSYSEIQGSIEDVDTGVKIDTKFKASSLNHEKAIGKVSYKLLNTCTNLKEESGGSFPTSPAEESSFGSATSKSLESETNILIETKKESSVHPKKSCIDPSVLSTLHMRSHPETSVENLPNTISWDFESKCEFLSRRYKNGCNKYFSEGNVETWNEITSTSQVVPIYQMKETKNSVQDKSEPKRFGNESVSNGDETANYKEINEMGLPLNNGQIEIMKLIGDSSSSQSELQRIEKKTPVNPLILKDRSLIENTNIDDEMRKRNNGQIDIIKLIGGSSSSQSELQRIEKKTPVNPLILKDHSLSENTNIDDEMRRRREARQELRKEQANHEVKIFLKMLLVLGDREGAEFLFSKLMAYNERTENTQECSKKRKKKNLKK